jgi:hypothetical protein
MQKEVPILIWKTDLKHINEIYEQFKLTQSPEVADELGEGIASSLCPVEIKKRAFQELFDMTSADSEPDSILNAWAVACMLEDDHPPANKILAVRNLLEDMFLPNESLDQWVQFVWTQGRVHADILEFLATDIKHCDRISDNVKQIVN